MKYTQLGRTGLKVSRLCLGSMNFGAKTDEQESFRIMDRALELGINFFDTADRYGEPMGEGITEQLIGRWLARGGGRRESIVLATKVFGPMGPGANDEGLSAYHIARGCEASLARLGTDRIDLYQMHHIDRGMPHRKSELVYLGGDLSNLKFPPHLRPGAGWEEIWQEIGRLLMSGKVTYVGSSNFAAWNIAQANEKAAARHFLGLVSEQSKYNLMQRSLELEVIPVCREYGLGLIPWSPLNAGLLAGKALESEGGRRHGSDADEKNRGRLERYGKLCRKLGEEPASIALAWLLHNPVVTAPIIGPRTLEQLEHSLRALEITLDDETLRELDDIFPGPGGQAPEAYAW